MISHSMHKKLRASVERLLSGSFSSHDLSTLYLSLREHNFGRVGFKDVGDFIAHSFDRERGFTCDIVSDYGEIVDFLGARLEVPPRDLDGETLSSALKAQWNLLERSRPWQLPFDQPTRRSLWGRLKKKIVGLKRGQPVVGSALTSQENSFLFSLFESFQAPAVFDGQIILNDFKYVLEKNGLLDKSEFGKIDKLEDRFVNFVMYYMHNCKVKRRDGEQVTLQISRSADDGLLDITFTAHLVKSTLIMSLLASDKKVDEAFENTDALEWIELGLKNEVDLSANGLLRALT